MIGIPLEIIRLCLAFFIYLEEWDINNKGKWLKFDGNSKQICKCTNPGKNIINIICWKYGFIKKTIDYFSKRKHLCKGIDAIFVNMNDKTCRVI